VGKGAMQELVFDRLLTALHGKRKLLGVHLRVLRGGIVQG
jgi:hypothetical protein